MRISLAPSVLHASGALCIRVPGLLCQDVHSEHSPHAPHAACARAHIRVYSFISKPKPIRLTIEEGGWLDCVAGWWRRGAVSPEENLVQRGIE